MGKYAEAIRAFDEAIAANKDYAPAYNNRGAAKFKLEYYREAVKDLTKAIDLQPDLASAYVNRGIAREMSRDQAGACNDWRKARELGLEEGKKYYINNCNE
jgi:tetratricopeptide (TPR) repeat protein